MSPTMVRSLVLVGSHVPSSVGSRSAGEDLALQLATVGWRVILTSRQPGRVARVVDIIRTLWRERYQYQVAQVDVYSGAAFLWAEAACWILRSMGKPYVLVLHGGELPVYAKRWSGRVRRLLAPAAAVTTPSHYLLSEMSCYRRDLTLLPNPVSLGAYSFRVRRPALPNLIWLRAFHEIYNPTLALEALALVAKQFPAVRLTMIGPDKGDGTFQRTQETAAALGLTERVNLISGIPKAQVPEELAQGDIFLNTTWADNTPVSVLEAMASGLCVVSTNVGGIPYLLDPDQDALLVPPGDPQAMAAAIIRILADRNLAGYLSRNARKKVEAFDWASILPRWDDLLVSVAAQTRNRYHSRSIEHAKSEQSFRNYPVQE